MHADKHIVQPIMKRLAWQQMAMCFLDSLNPKPHAEPLMVECILSYDGEIPATRIRHHAHAFMRATERIVSLKITPDSPNATEQWIVKWLDQNG